MIFPISLSKVLLTAGLLLSLAGLTSCQNILHSNGILIIAVENLKSDDVPCNDLPPNVRSGFNRLCHEFVHVKGMVTSSTSSVPALAALMTGEPPQKMGLFTNNDYLPAAKVTLSEKLHQLGRRTGYFYTAPPLSRRSGLTQGFDFVDEIVPSKKPVHMAEDNFNSFLTWLAEEPNKDYFALIAMSDLDHPEIQTQSDHGQIRGLSIESQLEEIDESLLHLIDAMKKAKRWDSTFVIVVGLQGRPERPDHLPLHLQMDAGHLVVPVFVKPAVPNPAGESDLSVEGTWTHAELGKLIAGIAKEPGGVTTNMTTLGNRLQALVPPIASSWGCVNQNNVAPLCRVVFFDANNSLPWDLPFYLDSPGKRALRNKVEQLPADDIPHRFDRRIKRIEPDWFNIAPFNRCVPEFYNRSLKESYAGICPGRTVQMLRDLYLNKSLDNRELRQPFIHRWADLAAASRLYDWSRIQASDMIPTSDPLAEYITLDKLLGRPEFADLRRDCERASALLMM